MKNPTEKAGTTAEPSFASISLRAWHASPEGRAAAERKSAKMKAWYASPAGQECAERSSARLKAQRASEGQATTERRSASIKAWYATPEGQAQARKQSEYMSANAPNRAWHKTRAGIAWHRYIGEKSLANGQLESMRELAKAKGWNKTPEASTFFRAVATRTAAARKPKYYTCKECGKDFQSKSFDVGLMYCSRKCKGAAFYRGGAHPVERTCLLCGIVFTRHVSIKTQHCSLRCATKHRMPNGPAHNPIRRSPAHHPIPRGPAPPFRCYKYSDTPIIIEPNQPIRSP